MSDHARRSVADLVRQARDPDASLSAQHAAFTALVERFARAALATALAAGDEPESARDACQEAFLAAWRLLPDLREPAAFGGWLKRLVRTPCARARRQRRDPARALDLAAAAGHVEADAEEEAERLDRRQAQRLIHHAVRQLPPAEREAVIRFYFLGEPLRAIARALGASPGHAGKQLYRARLRLRRSLPRSVTGTFLAARPTPAFARRVAAGVLDEFAGEYRFPDRPAHRVVIRRERDALVSYAGGQRNVLVSPRPDALRPSEFDGEGRFRRDPDGRVSHFVYYEFGRRLGVARKLEAAEEYRGRFR
jgi:RNA polymerase sigma-70 factor (ECF subfamily)